MLKDFNVNIKLLIGSLTKKEKEEIHEELKLGKIDIVIGTHAIIQEATEFSDLGLVVTDEQHRFGVKQRDKLTSKGHIPHVLIMSATPIPRTLHMSIVGIRDMSVIYDPPLNRKPIQTYVLEYDSDVIKEAIIKELERKGQVFYLYNKVENIEEKASEISRMVPEANVAFAHGQMTGKQIEQIKKLFCSIRTHKG